LKGLISVNALIFADYYFVIGGSVAVGFAAGTFWEKINQLFNRSLDELR
jgi:hypothetical protein